MVEETTTEKNEPQSTDTPFIDEQKQFKHWRKVVIAAGAGIAVSLGIYLEAIDIAFIIAMFAGAK